MAKEEVIKKEEKEEQIDSPLRSGMSDNVKGAIIAVVVLLIIGFFVILLVLGENDNRKGGSVAEEHNLNASDYSEALTEFYDYFNSEDRKVIVFASTQCGYCVAQKPYVETIGKKYGVDYLYMDYLELNNENGEVDIVIEELGISGATPTTVIVEDGEIIGSWEGYLDGQEYFEQLVKYDLISEDKKYDLEDNITDIDYEKFEELLDDSSVSAIFINTPYCGLCTTEKLALNDFAAEHKVKVYELNSIVLSEDEFKEFTEGLGKWGYTSEAYEENTENVEVPLLLFVKNGKIIDYTTGYVDGETDLEVLFEDAGLLD